MTNDMRRFLLLVLNVIAVSGLLLAHLWDSVHFPLYVYCLHCHDFVRAF